MRKALQLLAVECRSRDYNVKAILVLQRAYLDNLGQLVSNLLFFRIFPVLDSTSRKIVRSFPQAFVRHAMSSVPR
jgi:hypothetical protein